MQMNVGVSFFQTRPLEKIDPRERKLSFPSAVEAFLYITANFSQGKFLG